MVVAIVVVAVITNNKQKWLLRTYSVFQKFLIEDLNLKNSIKHCLTLLNTAISINMLRWVYTFYYKFRFREVTIFFNVTCLMNGGNGRRTEEVNGLNHLHCNLVLDWLLLRFFFYWSALFFWWWTWGLQFPCPHTLLIPFQSGSWPHVTTLNLILSMLPMIHNFLKLVVYLHPGFIWFTRSIWHSSFLLDIFSQLTFRTEYFLGFFPICWSCTLVSISASFSSLWLLKLKGLWA